jgi:hypothetical protein
LINQLKDKKRGQNMRDNREIIAKYTENEKNLDEFLNIAAMSVAHMMFADGIGQETTQYGKSKEQ